MTPERIAASILTCVVLAGCAGGAQMGETPQAIGESVAVAGGEYRHVVVPELETMLADKTFPLINVHIPFAGDLPRTDDSIPFNEIQDNLDRLPADKDATIVLYCRTGPMSERAAATLVGLGYTDVYSLVGGFEAWRAAGLPIEGR